MAKRSDSGASLLRTVGVTQWWGNGFWSHPWYVRDVRCEDGRRRTVYLGSDADSYFSWPGRTHIGRRSVKGTVLIETEEGLDTGAAIDTVFIAEKE